MISIVICAYDAARFLPQSLDSVLRQDFPESQREIVVVDDGSTDETERILKPYEGKIRLVRHASNRGMGEAMRSGIRAASGEIVAPLDADDVWRPQKLRRVAEAFAREPEAGLVSHRFEFADKDLKLLGQRFGLDHDRVFDLESEQLVSYHGRWRQFLLALPAGSAYAFRKAAVLPYLDGCRPPPWCADLFFLLLAAHGGRKAVYLAECLGSYRLRGNNVVLNPPGRNMTPEAMKRFLEAVPAPRPPLLADLRCLRLPAELSSAMGRPDKATRVAGCVKVLRDAFGQVPWRLWSRSARSTAAYALLPQRVYSWLCWRRLNVKLTAAARAATDGGR